MCCTNNESVFNSIYKYSKKFFDSGIQFTSLNIGSLCEKMIEMKTSPV